MLRDHVSNHLRKLTEPYQLNSLHAHIFHLCLLIIHVNHQYFDILCPDQLRKENKFLGNIITALKSNKSELEGTNTALQRHIHQISHQFTETTYVDNLFVNPSLSSHSLYGLYLILLIVDGSARRTRHFEISQLDYGENLIQCIVVNENRLHHWFPTN